TFAVDLSWSVPEQQVPFYLVAVSPPFGENQRDRVPVRAQQGEPSVSTTVSGLVCGETYTFVVQSIADDGITVLTNSEPTTATTPACE
ncbi:MAG: fibronectin type III domain-containing protein, partial [Anaerolineales bacterium]